MRRTRSTTRAFTLVEMLLAIVLIGVLALFAWPNFDHAGRTAQLRESVGRMRALVAMCRAQAMNEARQYRVVFDLDGSVGVLHQKDPLNAPEEFVSVAADWARLPYVLDEVWIEGVVDLPDGPAPIEVEDELIEFEEYDLQPVVLEQLEEPVMIEFAPDGSSNSVRWSFRDAFGHGREMTLDGRLGRIDVVDLDPVSRDELQRPKRERRTTPADDRGRAKP